MNTEEIDNINFTLLDFKNIKEKIQNPNEEKYKIINKYPSKKKLKDKDIVKPLIQICSQENYYVYDFDVKIVIPLVKFGNIINYTIGEYEPGLEIEHESNKYKITEIEFYSQKPMSKNYKKNGLKIDIIEEDKTKSIYLRQRKEPIGENLEKPKK